MIQRILPMLVPPFLRRLDRWLLLNHPRWWTTKVHYVVFYGLLVHLFATFLMVLIPFGPNQFSNFSSGLTTAGFLAEIIIFILWLNTQSLFSVEREFGFTNFMVGLAEIIVYMICVIFIFSPVTTIWATGVYKTASYLDTRKTNVCEGPVLVEFYSDYSLNFIKKKDNDDWGYDMGKLQAALRFADDAVVTGRVKKIIGISYSTFREHYYFASFLESPFVSSDGNDGLIVDDEHNKLLLIKGKGGLREYSYDIWKFEEENTTYDNAYKLCKGVVHFTRDLNTYFENDGQKDPIGVYGLIVTSVVLLFLGISFTVLLKNTNWRIVLYVFLYLLISIIVLSMLGAGFSSMFTASTNLYSNIGLSSLSAASVSNLTVYIIFLVFILLQSIRLIGAKKTKEFAFINFASLLIILGFFVFLIPVLRTGFVLKDVILPLVVFFGVYILFTPFQKGILTYLMSLPRD